MKRLLLFFTLGFPYFAESQTGKPIPSQTIVKLSPQHVGINTFLTSIEQFDKSFSKSLSFDLGIRYRGRFLEAGDQVERGVHIGVEYRRYIGGFKAIFTDQKRTEAQGFYVGPFAHFGMVRVRQLTAIRSSPLFGNPPQFLHLYEHNHFEDYFAATGLMIGVQRTFWNVLALDVFAGCGMRWSHVRFLEQQQRPLNTDVSTPGYQGILPHVGIKIGVVL